MIVSIKLNYNNGFEWQRTDELSIKGYIIDKGFGYITGKKLHDYFLSVLSNCTDYLSLLKNINGVFSFIYSTNDFTILYSDKTRFFPLFYRQTNDGLSISDHPELLINKTDSIDLNSFHEFRLTGYTTGKNTLYKNIYQVQASELLVIKNNHIKSQFSFSFKAKRKEKILHSNPKLELYNAIENTFTPILASLQGKTPVLPLSGGFDSRLIACKLKDMGFDNTICFTYGRPGKEVELSQKVANKLNFKWYFLNYEELVKDRNLLQENEFLQYFSFAGRGTSMFYLQEFPAVEFLKKNNILPDNSVFLPGHSGDLLGGSQLIKTCSPKISRSKVARQILKTKYFQFPMSRSEVKTYTNSIERQIQPANDYLGYSIYEDWDIKEKIAKFIFNSSQVFCYFGYEIRFPFWDNELMEFFRTLPVEHRIGKKLYDHCLRDHYFSKYDLNFDNELNARLYKIRIQLFKDKLKSYLPRNIIYSNIRKNDWTCYYEMSIPMLSEIDEKTREKLPYKSFNSILINWYLTKVQSNFQ